MRLENNEYEMCGQKIDGILVDSKCWEAILTITVANGHECDPYLIKAKAEHQNVR